jgi:hypothetical protein
MLTLPRMGTRRELEEEEVKVTRCSEDENCMAHALVWPWKHHEVPEEGFRR